MSIEESVAVEKHKIERSGKTKECPWIVAEEKNIHSFKYDVAA